MISYTNIIKRLLETTTMSNISYLPGGFNNVKSIFKSLAKEKPDWKIELLEQDDERIMTIEDRVRITVNNKDWDEFNSFIKLKDSTLYLGDDTLIKESENPLGELRNQLKAELISYFNRPEFKAVDTQYENVSSLFGITKYIDSSIAVKAFHKKLDIFKVYGELLRKSAENRGQLEMLITNLQKQEPISNFNIVTSKNAVVPLSKAYTHLYGFRCLSTLYKIELVTEVTLDYSLFSNQSILIFGDMKAASFIEDNVKGVKVIKNIIYPATGKFTLNLLAAIKNAIKDYSN